MKLTKTINGKTISLSQVDGNDFLLKGEFSFKAGKGANYSDGTAINQPKISETEVKITKAEIKRLGTYNLLVDGEKFSCYGEWLDEKGRIINFNSETDIYYYFRRPDCGIVKTVQNGTGHVYYSGFHYKLGQTIGRGAKAGSEIIVEEK